jgi:hypothetical protein
MFFEHHCMIFVVFWKFFPSTTKLKKKNLDSYWLIHMLLDNFKTLSAGMLYVLYSA